MGGYQATLGRGLVYFLSYTNLQESHMYYIDSTMAKAAPILVIKDEPDDHSWLPAGLRQMGDLMGSRTVQLILDQQRSYFRELQSESIFKLKDSVYIIDLNNNKWRFLPLDPVTGEIGSQIDLPRYTAMSNIRIHGGAIYFIYPEKIYPYYQRVYRKTVH